MKNLNLLIILLACNLTLKAQNPIIKINSGTTGGNNGKCVQIGSENTNGNLWYLSLGKGTGTPNWGAWALEHWDGGLNFGKPYPTSNFGNYKLHITDDGFVGINGKANSSLNVGVRQIYVYKYLGTLFLTDGLLFLTPQLKKML